MWALVIFADEIKYLCPLWKVCYRRKKISVKYTDNKKYAARVLAICHDKAVLTQLKSNLEGDLQNIQDCWKLDGSRGVDYSKASMVAAENDEEDILFVDKQILLQSNTNAAILFTLSEDIDLDNFVLEQSQFQRLRKELKNTDDNKVVPSEDSSMDEEEPQEVSTTVDQTTSLEKTPVNLKNNVNSTTVICEGSGKVESDDSLVNETDSFLKSSITPIKSNIIINETPPESSFQNDSSDLSSLQSPGQPTFSSTIQERSISPMIPSSNVRDVENPTLEKISRVGSTIIDSSSLTEDIDSTPSEEYEKSNFTGSGPISKPLFCVDNKMNEYKLFSNKLKHTAHCSKQEEPLIPKSLNNKIQIEGVQKIQNDGLNGNGRENVSESPHNVRSNELSQNRNADNGEFQPKKSIDETSNTTGTPPVDFNEENSELNNQHNDLNETYTCTSSSILKNLQSSNYQPSLIIPKLPRMDEKSLGQNYFENATFSPSKVLRASPKSRRMSAESELFGIDIDPFKNNVHLNEDDLSDRNDEIQTEGMIKDVGIKKVASSRKRKERPKIIHEEIVNIPLFKKQKIDDTVEDNSSSRQIDQSSRYNTRKKDKSVAKGTHPEGSRPESSKPEERVSVDEEEIIKPETGPKRKVVFEFNESDEDDDESPEYMPSDDESSGSDGEGDLSTDGEELEEDLQIEKKLSDSLDITIGNDEQISAPDDSELAVDSTSSRVKKHFCFFCKKMQTKLARHLELVHSKEEEVKKFIALPPRNKERQEIIASIRKNGDHLYNTDRQVNNGTLIVCRRSTAHRGKTAKDFIACGNCRGQYSRSVIRHHWRRCTKRTGKHERIVLVKGKKVSARVHERANADVRKHIFPYLREDEIVRSVRYDELLILFANKQCEKYGTNPHLYQMIRARLRLLGRCLVAIKQLNSRITTFTDIFQPRNYDSMIDAVKKVAVFVPETKTFKHPAVGSQLGTLLKQVGEVLRSEFIKRESGDQQKQVQDFLNLLAEDYGTSINRVVTETQTQHHRRKEVKLPSTDDIAKFYNYIVNERTKYLSQMIEEFSFDTWKKLGETTLLSLQIFNRRRPGELERLYIDDYRSSRGIDDMADKEIYDTLSAEGQALAKRYVRFEIRGKRNRAVPVLVDGDVVDCLEMILRYRNEAHVPDGNLYLFGLPSSDKDRHKYLRACNLMREYSVKCGAEIPHLLRGTELRKHIATRCIQMNLEGSQVTDLANFMGHHENIHKQIYRQPVAATDIVKISKILNIVQGVEGADDDSDDGNTSQSTPRRRKSNEPNASMDDTVYGLGTSATSYTSQKSQSSVQSESSTNKRNWGDEQRSAVLSAFLSQLENGNIPSGKEMQQLIDREQCLSGRTVAQMRTWLHTYKKKLTQ